MQAGASRAVRRTHGKRRFRGGHSDVMHEHQHGPMLEAERREGVLELVAIGDVRGRVRIHALLAAQQPEVGALTSFAPSLGMACVHEKPMHPGLESVGIPQLREAAPGRHEGMLGRVFREGGVAQDPARDGIEAVPDASDQQVERLLVAVHRQLDEPPVHLDLNGVGPLGGTDH